MTSENPANTTSIAEPAAKKISLPGPLKEVYRSTVFGLKWLLGQVLRTPVTVTLIAVMWLLRALIGPDPENMWAALGMSMPFKIFDWHLFSSALSTGLHSGAILATIAALISAVPAERLLGSVRFAITAFGLHVIGVPIVMVGAHLVDSSGLNFWGGALMKETLLTPMGWMLGTAALATSRMPLLWRRRVRLILGVLVAAMVLYSGNLSDVLAAVAVALGLLDGMVVRKEPVPLIGRHVSHREGRNLVAMLCFLVALGPVIAGLNPLADGPFSVTTAFLWEPEVSLEYLQVVCTADAQSEACRNALINSQFSGVGAAIANLMPLIVQAVICWGLARGRHVAWWLAIVAQLVTMGVAMSQLYLTLQRNATASGETLDLHIWILLGAFICLPWIVCLLTLITTRHYFRVPIRLESISWFALWFVIAQAFSAAVWILVGLSVKSSFRPTATVGLLLQDLPGIWLPPVFATMLDHALVAQTPLTLTLSAWVTNLLWLPIVVALYFMLMSVPDPSAERDRDRARELLRRGSGDHLSWMTVWPDNRYWFASDDRGYVAYRVRNGIAVTVGEPVASHKPFHDSGLVGEDTQRLVAQLADEFEKFASGQGWDVAWYSVREEFSSNRAVHRGYYRVRVAEESVLSTDAIEFKGKKFQNIRTARNRAKKEGIRTEWLSWADTSPELQDRIIALSEEWVADKSLPEMGFTLGGIEELQDPDTMLLLAVDEENQVHGVTSWLPVYEHGQIVGYTLDFMRRNTAGFRPVIEYLLAEAAVKAAELGLQWVSLSGAPLARTQAPSAQAPSKEAPSTDTAMPAEHQLTASTQEAGNTPMLTEEIPSVLRPELLDQGLEKLGELMEPLYGFRSLAASKYKFHPQHHDWFLCYNDELALPKIGIAISGCYLPDFSPRDAVKAVKMLATSEK